MKLNIAYPATGCQKLIEIEDDRKLRVFFDKKMAQEVPGDSLGDEWKGYVFRIGGGNDKQGECYVKIFVDKQDQFKRVIIKNQGWKRKDVNKYSIRDECNGYESYKMWFSSENCCNNALFTANDQSFTYERLRTVIMASSPSHITVMKVTKACSPSTQFHDLDSSDSSNCAADASTFSLCFFTAAFVSTRYSSRNS